MKYIIILGDGMADYPIKRLGGQTPLQYAQTPNMDLLAKLGRTGRLITIPDGFSPGSEVANTVIMGYNLKQVYEGRGPLEAASIGYEMRQDDFAMRCNIITLQDGKIKNHHGGHLTTLQADKLIKILNEKLGNDNVRFLTGTQYRHLLVINRGNKHVVCAPPHDHPDEAWRELLVTPEKGWENKTDGNRMTGNETAELINKLILLSQEILNDSNANVQLSIWPWGGGYRPAMKALNEIYPQIKSGAVISAVDLIRGIGHYAGLRIIEVEGATGLADTNYEGKAKAALTALRTDDFVYLHIEASDEASHDGDLDLKIKTIENLDRLIVGPIFNEVRTWHDEQVCVAVLPDHPTPVEIRTHVNEPVPFAIWFPGINPDNVHTYNEVSCVCGGYGLLRQKEFIATLLNSK